MTKKTVPFLLICLCLLLTAACQNEPPTEDPDALTPDGSNEDLLRDTSTPTVSPSPSGTPLPGLPPTNTPAPSGTPAPILQAQPSRTRAPSPTPFFLETVVVGSEATAPAGGSTTGGTGNATTTPVAQAPGEVNGLTELNAAAAAYSSLDTVRVVRTGTVDESDTNEFQLGLSQTCDVRRPSDFYCRNTYQITFTDDTQDVDVSNEAVKLGNQYWTRPSSNDEWTERTLEQVEDSGFTIESIERFLIPAFVDNIQSVQTTVLNGESVYRIQYNIDDDTFIEQMLDDDAVAVPTNATIRGSGVAWIGVDDKYPRRSIIDVDAIGENNEMVEIIIQSDYSNFNEAVTIPDPRTEN